MDLLRELSRQHLETKEQFRQVLGMFYQMHQEQMALVTGEMHRLGRLVEELAVRRVTPDSRSRSLDSSSPDSRTFNSPTLEGLRDRSPSRLPLPALAATSVAESPLIPEKWTETECRGLPKSGSRSEAKPDTSNSPDPSGGFHLILARRIAACRSKSQGRLKKMINWFNVATRANRPA
ncbi:hypothetical protein [Singulisphaera acidiphila]|uniref:hypothetical protein n=1 Tax=Singulisphaera acidiphila TaxID=466153 RepID=UPI001ED97F35|nr:hypothetical protein [Singulisphaera acidiphila]